MTQELTKQINGRGQWILLALLLFCTIPSLSQDTLSNNNSIRLGFGPSYTGWNVELAYSRRFQKIELGLAGKYVFGSTINGENGNLGLNISGFYHLLRSKKIWAYCGPTIGLLQVEAKGLPENNLYLEFYFMIGIQHRLSQRLRLGYEVGYGGVVSFLYDRYFEGRRKEWKQASTLKVYLSYPF